ncbi:hypothetical protein [Rudanella lutea]|uniref:hypothetical protein n=1 Tax=Rudanella lutea TaxID=451374 RepID=UPI0003820D9D|nr:hypothetical protein [Rudanella lutea]
MNRFRVISSVLFGLVLLASVLAPAEVGALVPPSMHDFMFGPEGVTLAATVSFTPIKRKERQKSNLGGIMKLVLFSASDFTDDWPKADDIAAGKLSEVPPLKNGVVGAPLTFDLNTCQVKSTRKGELGYQNVDVSGVAKFAGYEADQIAALDKTINEGGVAIATYKDGTRVVYGTSYEPLTFEDETDSGTKADDKLQMDLKFMGKGYAFHPPVLEAAVVIPMPA